MYRASLKKRIRRFFKSCGAIPSQLERWLAYRTYDRYNVIYTDLEPGYYDKDTLLLHGCFSLLVCYVENEISAYTTDTGSKKRGSQHPSIAYLYRVIGENTNEVRNKLGDDPERYHLEAQTAFYTELIKLYLWWTEERPSRGDPFVLSGWEALKDALIAEYGTLYYSVPLTVNGCELFRMEQVGTHDQTVTLSAALTEANKIEARYEQEDEDMLIRLIKIRRNLWT